MNYVIDENLTILMHSCEKFVMHSDDDSIIDDLKLLAKISVQDEWFSCEFSTVTDSIKWTNRLSILSGQYATLRKAPLFAYLECIRRSSGLGATILMHKKGANNYEVYLKPDYDMKC
jgi:hypothetical protein